MFKLTDNQIFVAVAVFILLVAIFYPRNKPLFSAGVSAHLGNLGANVSFEAFESGDDEKTFALFYAPWCPHCKSIMGDWDTLTKKNKTGVKIQKVNCDENEDLAKKHGIKSFPTIKFLPKGLNNPADAIDYKGERKGEAFLAFVEKMK